jgi:hypothetical protein
MRGVREVSFSDRPGAFDVTKEDVERLRYLNNPRKAAQYLGIPQAQVEDVWAEMPDHRERGGSIGPRESTGRNASAIFRRKARCGSERLREQVVGSMLRWGEINGTTPEETVGFLLYGKTA